MKSIIKENITRYVTDKRKILLLTIFSFFCGTEVNKAQAAQMSLFEFVLFVMSNHYYIIYFMFMAYIFFMFDNMRSETSLMRIRLRTVKKQYICRVVVIFIQSAIYVGAHFLIAAAIGSMRFDYSNSFNVRAIDGYYSETIDFMLEYCNYINTPLNACLFTGIYMIGGLTFLAVMIYVLDGIFGRKISLGAVGVIILDIMAGFKMGINGAAGVLFLNNYFIFHHVLFGGGKICIAINCIAAFAGVFLGGKLFIRKLANNRADNNCRKKKNAYLKQMFGKSAGICTLFLAGYVLLNAVTARQAEDVIFLNIAGYSHEKFYFFEFVRYLIYYFVPVFFVGVIAEREKKMYNAQVAIRYGRNKWSRMIEKNIDMFIIRYYITFLIFLGSTVVVSALLYKNGTTNSILSEFAGYMNIKVSDITLMAVVALAAKLPETMYYKEIYMFIYTLTKNSIASFIITFAGFIVTALIQCPFISYGASALYNLAGEVVRNGVFAAYAAALLMPVIKIVVLKIIRKKL